MSSYHENHIRQIRPESTFENFKVYDPRQQQVLDTMQGLAHQIVENADAIAGQEYPFPYGQMIFLWSEPGHGKSHLLEAFARYILENAPELLDSLYLARGDFTLRHIGSVNLYGKCPIVLIDDLFAEYQSTSALNVHTDLICLMNYLTAVYERRTLVIATSNFPMLSPAKIAQVGIIQRIAEVDKVGRTLSRCKELLATAGEMHLAGHDYRDDIAKERKDGLRRVKLRLPFAGRR